jgi:hypothetical protein
MQNKLFLLPGEIIVYKDHFYQGAKMFNQSFRLVLPAPEW